MIYGVLLLKNGMIWLSVLVLFVTIISGQSTAFTYQGNLTNSGGPASGNFDFEFRLFDAADEGNQLGAMVPRLAVPVSNGVFKVDLDFGDQFPGSVRYLEIRLRTAGSIGYTVLAPRQSLSATPYAVRSLNALNAVIANSAQQATTATTANNALQLGGVAANQYVITTDPRMVNARQPTAGSESYIQNQTATPQASTGFSIDGIGRAGQFDAASYKIAGIDVLRVSAADRNTVIGQTQISSVATEDNVLVGYETGRNSSTETGGTWNTFVGSRAGTGNIGSNNTGIGAGTRFQGFPNGGGITLIGADASASFPFNTITNSTAIGYRSSVNTANSIVLGSVAGQNGADTTVNVGIGTSSPGARLHLRNSASRTLFGELNCNTSFAAISFSTSLDCGFYAGIAGDGNSVIVNRRTGHFVLFREGNVDQIFILPGGTIQLNALGAGTVGSQSTLCRNSSNQIAFCGSSSVKYKTDIGTYFGGLDVVTRLQPVAFTLKSDGNRDLGLVAENVNEIEPLLTYTDKEGAVDGVRYERIPVVLINAIKEQQSQLERQSQKISEQEKRIELLVKIACEANRSLEFCKEN